MPIITTQDLSMRYPGVTALESVGIMLDPATKTLKRLPAVPLK